MRNELIENIEKLHTAKIAFYRTEYKKMIKIRYGNTNTYFMQGKDSGVLIDTDYAGTLPAFYKAIKECDIKVADITYVLATHYHPDHVGLVSKLMEQGVKLLLMESQMVSVHFADGIFSREPKLGYRPIDEGKATIISFEESRGFLASLGIDGEIISTPSHSKDSISIILDEGSCIVGDLEPIDYLEAYDKNEALKRDWERILEYDPKRVLYAHANEKVLSMFGDCWLHRINARQGKQYRHS